MNNAGKLYVVATPIGNLGDFSPRAVEALRSADFIAAEDTRVTAKLLNHFEIKKPLVSYYQHNMYERGEAVIERILGGDTCALCSDAGTPAVSDPGELLVKQAIDAGIEVVPIPGACAAITALCASGLVTGRFVFEGFIPVNRKCRKERLEEIKNETRTLIFYEAPHKLKNTLADMLAVFGDREMTLARELTKLHEEIVKTTLSAANEAYAEREPRGEYVLVVSGKSEDETKKEATSEDALDIVNRLLSEGHTLSEACKQAAAITNRKKGELYKLALNNRDTE
ncbi:MAG: 16S rRNA (cytidine(1402)-2'-O)-methyltransferase [Ruminococcaceae bacterium]|nr:16S rRNA (cytidine(1402)-2'-O)-methyltransferase [Oscillospiraceae bacterium]